MKYRLASLALLLCLIVGGTGTFCAPSPSASPPSAVDPLTLTTQAEPTDKAKIVLIAPLTVRIGELVRFDVSDSAADSFKWLLVPLSEDFLVYDSGARAVFSARTAGEYRFIVACAKDGSVDVVTHLVRVTEPPTTPTTDSLSEWIPFWNWDTGLPREECEKLADSFEALAARRDELTTPGDWIKATAEANRAILGERLHAWTPLLDKIGKNLRKRAETGTLITPADHEKVWLEIAQGLRNC
jgi:hypothetical protein